MSTLYITKGVTTFKDIHDDYNKYNWTDTQIEFDLSMDRGFEVKFSTDHPNYKIILRPAKFIMKREFEEMFGLGIGGIGYSESKIVAISNNKYRF